MKLENSFRSFLALAGSSLLTISSTSAQATSATWDTNADGDWTDPLNWTGDTNYAGGADNTATFGNFINTNRVINLNAGIIIGNITASDTSNNYTISGANILTLDRTLGNIPVIDVTTAGRTLTINSQISGADGLQKDGAGILQLSNASNNFSGGITINTGRLSIGADAHMGAASNSITLNGGELYLNNGTDFSSARDVILNAVSGNQILLQGNQDWNNSGSFTGDGGITFAHSRSGNVSATLTSESNTFKGALKLNTDNAFLTVRMRSLADSTEANGNIIFGAKTATQTFEWDSAASTALALNHRQIEFGDDGNASGRILNSNSTHAINIDTDLLISGTGTKTLTLDAPQTNPANTFSGDLTDGNGTLNLVKSGGGSWTLSGNNSFSGTVTISQGTLAVNSLANFGTGTIGFGINGSTGTLRYTGGAETISRSIQINSANNNNAGGATIINDGAGALTFTAPTFNNPYTTTIGATRTLTLGGTNGGTIQGIIQNNNTSQIVALTKTGTGTWTLSGENSYTGNTAVNGGILTFANVASKSAGSAVSANASGTVGLGVRTGDAAYYSAVNVGNLFNTNTLSGFNLNAASGVAIDTTNAGGSFDQTVALTGSRALTKLGTGALNLSQTNTYSGATVVSAGTLYVTGALSNSAVAVGANGAIGSNGAAGTLGNGLTIEDGGNLDLTGAALALNSTGILSITSGALTLGNLTFQDLVGWDWANASVGTYELIDGNFTINWGSTAYLDADSAYNFGNGYAGYFQSGSLTAVIIAIPEPGVAMMAGLSLLGLLRRRRV